LIRADDLKKFYAAVKKLPNPVARDYLLLILFTGLRRSEAAGLTWDDVDFAARIIRVKASATKTKRKLDLPMSYFVFSLLLARRKIGDTNWIFPADSKSGRISEPKFPLKLVKAETGIEVSVHDLRRTFITAAESTNMSAYALKALVNHVIDDGGGDVTAGYIQMTTNRLREPAQQVCDLLMEWRGIKQIKE
jgi:integrase